MKVQLESLAINKEETTLTLKDVVAYLKELDKNSWDYFSEVFTLVKLILVVPATNALSERSCSALRRLKTYLRTTMCQDSLNHCMILYVHKELTDALEITDIGNQFVSIVRTKLDSAALEDSNHRYPRGTEKTIYGHLLL